jgi:phosphopentomutase
MVKSNSFSAIDATIAENFGIEMPKNTIGESVLNKLI